MARLTAGKIRPQSPLENAKLSTPYCDCLNIDIHCLLLALLWFCSFYFTNCGCNTKRWLLTTTQVNAAHPVQPNDLARDFTASAPNQKWVADITYIPTRQGWLSVAGIVDLFSRQVVGLSMESRMLTDLVARAWHMAQQQRRPQAGLLIRVIAVASIPVSAIKPIWLTIRFRSV